MLLCTAGHVDHGKSSLIRALTGTETDTLAEEKRRGLTIELGFAYTSTVAGNRLGFVDVPGHSKFIRNMAAGVAGVDVALLVVDAREGIKPQTQEHAALLGLFGIKQCIVVITKTDLLALDDKSTQLQSLVIQCTSLVESHNIQCLHTAYVSSQSGEGIEDLKSYLFSLADSFTNISANGMFRLAVDRAFSIKGTGTVVTGTVYSGEISTDNTISLLPSGHLCRIKGMYVDGTQADTAVAGNRAAFNLTGIETSQLKRGDWLCATDQRTVTACTDVEISILPMHTLRHWQKVHVHGGSDMTPARVSLYDVRSIDGGSKAYAQLVFENPQHCVVNDLLVLRDQNALSTIGNAQVLEPHSSRKKEYRANRSTVLRLSNCDNTDEALAALLKNTNQPIDSEEFRQSRNLKQSEFIELPSYISSFKTGINPPAGTKAKLVLSTGSQWMLSHARKDELSSSLLQAVEDFHQKEPFKAGIKREILLQQENCRHARGQLVFYCLLHSGSLAQQGQLVSLPEFKPTLTPANQRLLDQLSKHITADNLKPPSLAALAESIGIDRELLSKRILPLEESGHLVRVAENRIYHPDAFKKLLETAIELNEQHGDQGFEAKTFKDTAGIGRNLTIDVLEYMDLRGLTRRLGDRRIVRQDH